MCNKLQKSQTRCWRYFCSSTEHTGVVISIFDWFPWCETSLFHTFSLLQKLSITLNTAIRSTAEWQMERHGFGLAGLSKYQYGHMNLKVSDQCDTLTWWIPRNFLAIERVYSLQRIHLNRVVQSWERKVKTIELLIICLWFKQLLKCV